MEKLMILFAAGCVGGLANSLVVWLMGAGGITGSMGVSVAPTLSASWLYPRIVWGGLWGFIFILPFLQTKWLLKGAFLSVFPTLVQLFIVFPYKAHKGFLGLELGLLTPVFVLFFNAVWGWATAMAIKLSK